MRHASIILCTQLVCHEILSLFQIYCYDTVILLLGRQRICIYQKEKRGMIDVLFKYSLYISPLN